MVIIPMIHEFHPSVSGLAARWFGVPWAIAGGGIATIVIAGAFAVGFPALRKIDRFDDVKVEVPG